MKKMKGVILLIIVLPYLTGCYTPQEIRNENIGDGTRGKLIIRSGDLVRYEFGRNMYSVTADSVEGYGIRMNTGEEEVPFTGKVALNDITSAHLEQLDPYATGCLGIGILGLALIIGFGLADFKVPISFPEDFLSLNPYHLHS